MSTLGTIEIQMLANLARLQQDMNAAKGMVGNATSAIQSSVNFAKNAFVGLAAGLSVGAFSNWIKGAIDAADEAFNLSQKIGVSTKDLAGMKLAFQQAGIGSEGMQKALVALSKGVAENKEVFGQLGVAVRNSDGTLRTTRAVLGDLADSFKGMPDGIRKTSMATEAFGKAGADLIPLLNQGAAGLDEMDQMAAKLGLTISDETAKAADDFNDTLELIGQGGKGVATQIAAQMLPTLTSLAQGFLTSMTQGNRLASVAQVLSTMLKGLYSVAVGVVGYITALGRSLGGLAAATVQLASGEFRAAAETMKATYSDTGDTIRATASQISQAWEDTGGESVQAAVTMSRASGEMVVRTKEQEAAIKAAAAEAKRAAEEAKKNTEAVLKAQAEQEKWRKEWFDEEAKRDLQRIAQYEATQNAEDARVASAAQMVAAIRRETEQLAMSNEEREISIALLKLEESGIVKGSYVYGVYAAQIRAAIVDRNAVKESIEQTKAIGDEWKRSVDAINASLSDALFRAFESGKGFADAFKTTLANAFKTLILQPTIKAVLAPISGAIGSMFSGTASASGGGAGGGMSLMGSLGSMVGGLGSLGTIFGTGASLSLGGGFGAAMGSAGAMMSGGASMSGLAMGAGALAPYAVAAYALYQAFKHKATPHVGSAVNLSAAGASTLWGDGSGFTNSFSAETDAALRSLGGGSVGGLNTLAAAFGGAANFGGQARFAADGKDASIGQYQLTRAGLSVGGVGLTPGGKAYTSDGAEAFKAFSADVLRASVNALSQIGLPQWARKQFQELGSGATIDNFNAVAQAVAQTNVALLGLQEGLQPLGGVFGRVAGLSSDALYQLTEFAGGIDAFARKAQSFVQNYYSKDEQAGIQARDVIASLKAAGFSDATIAGLDTRAEFRALAESRNVGTARGREQLAALLTIGDAFAGLTDIMTEQGKGLNALAAAAPGGSGALGNLLTDSANAGTPELTVSSQIGQTNTLLQQVIDTVTTTSANVTTALNTGAAATVAAVNKVAVVFTDANRGQGTGYYGDIGSEPIGGA